MKIEYDATQEPYTGVHAKLRTTASHTGELFQEFTFVLQIGGMAIEIEDKTAVNLSEDLLSCVSDAHDPTSAMRQNWAKRFTPNGNGTYRVELP